MDSEASSPASRFAAKVPSPEKGEPWFDDGNIVLLTGESEVAFKVHRGVLARHSEIFQSMFGLPQPSADLELYEGCQVVHMHDNPTELSHLIVALYDGVTFHTRNLSDFFHLAAILRLSTKYFVNRLRTKAILYLTETWCYDLDAHDKMVQRALVAPITHDSISYPYAHPLHVLNLTREVNIQIVVPSVMYNLSLYPLEDILRADHPKLVSKHPSKPSSELSHVDLKDYTLMFQHRWRGMIDFVDHVLGNRTAGLGCLNRAPICEKTLHRHTNRILRSWTFRTSPLHFMTQVSNELAVDANICTVCRVAVEGDIVTFRQEFWNTLPAVIGLLSWDALKAQDLSL